ncbi:MAG: PTS mannose/fructose/sorbose transporter family subunit IID [Spirochaetes bacterium]|nr:PTS mannose/fructose/sorbose transporter family subunit IID [Spirochaetota bacterium]
MKPKIELKDFFKVYWRSFFYQNLLNQRNYQNYGFMYVMYPAIKKFKLKKESVVDSLLRNFEYFNTNPYFASFIFGVALKLIQEDNQDRLNQFKFDIMSPLAGLGDAFSWGITRPFLILISIGLIMLGPVWGWIIFLLGFNIILNGFIRFFGIVLGYKHGINVIFNLAKLNLQNIILKLKQALLVIWGVLFYLVSLGKYRMIPVTHYYYGRENIMILHLFITLCLFAGILIFQYLNKKLVPVVTFMIYLLVIIFINFVYN